MVEIADGDAFGVIAVGELDAAEAWAGDFFGEAHATVEEIVECDVFDTEFAARDAKGDLAVAAAIIASAGPSAPSTAMAPWTCIENSLQPPGRGVMLARPLRGFLAETIWRAISLPWASRVTR
jgi:hypothetical protein